MKNKFFCIISIIWFLSIGTFAYAEWNFGIGLGPSFLNVDGEMGFDTTIAGPVQFDIELDPDDISDLMDKAFGLGGYAENGKWLFQLSAGKLELEGTATKGSVWTKIDFDTTAAEFITNYAIYQSSQMKVGLRGGVRYIEHELSINVTNGGNSASKTIKNDWTDAVIGVSVGFPFAKNWLWSNSFDAGFGGSEGTYTVKTGLTWRFFEHWTSTLFINYAAIEFENGSRGGTDWYLYDAEETSVGMTFMYNW